MVNSLVVIACENERKLIPAKYRNYKTIVTGVGALNVISKLRHFDENTQIFNFGYVGSKDYEIGKTYEIKESKLYHPDVEFDDISYRLSDNGVICFSSGNFDCRPVKNVKAVYDMELAFICALFKNVHSFKTVSDSMNYEEYERNIEHGIV